MKVLRVEWIDSCASNQNWIFPEDLDGEIQPIYIITYGFLVQETEDTITLAQNYGVEPEQVCNFMTIPVGCIKSRKIVEE